MSRGCPCAGDCPVSQLEEDIDEVEAERDQLAKEVEIVKSDIKVVMDVCKDKDKEIETLKARQNCKICLHMELRKCEDCPMFIENMFKKEKELDKLIEELRARIDNAIQRMTTFLWLDETDINSAKIVLNILQGKDEDS